MSDKQQRACELWLANDAGFYDMTREAALEAAREAFRNGGDDDAARKEALEAVEGEVETTLEAVEEQIDEALRRIGGFAVDLASFDRRAIDTREVAEVVVDIDDVVNEARELEDDDGGEDTGGDDFAALLGALWCERGAVGNSPNDWRWVDGERIALAYFADLYRAENGGAAAPWAEEGCAWNAFEAWLRDACAAHGWRIVGEPVRPCEVALYRGEVMDNGQTAWGCIGIFSDGSMF